MASQSQTAISHSLYDFQQWSDPELREKGVESLWHYRCSERTPIERVIPDGKIDLIFHLGDPMMRTVDGNSQVNPSANLVGPMTKPYLIEPMGKSHMIGVRFNAASARNFFHFDLGTIRNQVIDLADIWPSSSVEFILESGNQYLGIILIKRALLTNLKESTHNWLSQCIDWVGRNHGHLTVECLAQNTGYSTRYLEKVFRQSIGMTPGQFLSIARLQAAIDSHRKDPSLSMSQLAYKHGYFDQSHLNKDFTRYIGTTPRRFFRESHPMLDTTQSA